MNAHKRVDKGHMMVVYLRSLSQIPNLIVHSYLHLFGWLVEFYGISTFVGYLMPNPFSYK